jgi:ParB-like nuclease domain
MNDSAFAELVADIKLNGQCEPIVIQAGMILDGWHRYRACLAAGIEPLTIPWDGKGSPESFVISKNLHRRHLTQSQRAVVAAGLAKLKVGDNQHVRQGAQICATSQAEAAGLLNVSRRSVQHAATIIAKGAPELVKAVERGEITVSTATKLVNLPKSRQREIAEAGGRRAGRLATRAARRTISMRTAAARRRKPVTETEETATNIAIPSIDGSGVGPIDYCAKEMHRLIVATLKMLGSHDRIRLLARCQEVLGEIAKGAESSIGAASTKLEVITPPEVAELPFAKASQPTAGAEDDLAIPSYLRRPRSDPADEDPRATTLP